jgi:hypothetical protein
MIGANICATECRDVIERDTHGRLVYGKVVACWVDDPQELSPVAPYVCGHCGHDFKLPVWRAAQKEGTDG